MLLWEGQAPRVGFPRGKGSWGQRKRFSLPQSLPQRSVPRSASTAAVWLPVGASVSRAGGARTAPAVSAGGLGGLGGLGGRAGRTFPTAHRGLAPQGRHPNTPRAPEQPAAFSEVGHRARVWGVGLDSWRLGRGRPLVTPFCPPHPAACAPGVWGPQCDEPCHCGNGSSCDPKSGTCFCPLGLQPPRCLQPCPPGQYGPACGLRCRCHGAPCDPRTGACFCPPERKGPRCTTGSWAQDHLGLHAD